LTGSPVIQNNIRFFWTEPYHIHILEVHKRIIGLHLILVAAFIVFSLSCSRTGVELDQAPDSSTTAVVTGDVEVSVTGTNTPFHPGDPTDTFEASPTPTAIEVVRPTPIPPSETPPPVTRFAVIGDYGLAGEPEHDVADLVKSWNPDFIITTGDNNYPDGKAETIDENIGQYFHEYIFPYVGAYGPGAEINRFFPTLGNHDWNTAKAQPYFDYFTLPGNERYYDFVWGSVHLFAIDSDSREPDGVGRSSVQAQWLEQRLAASSAPWKVVYMHQSPYASAGDGSIDWAQWPYQEWGADVVLSGHSHVYERLIVDGFTYFVNGLGGGPRYDFNSPLPGSQVRFRDDYGAMYIEATSDEISFQFITRTGQVVDLYVLQK
jgi:hypothetical protein